MKAARSRLAQWGAEGEALVVETGRPWRLILWEKAQYVPCWDLGGDRWFSTEWFETHSPESPHCFEPIMDKECRFSKAQFLESGPARATVRWQYALCDNRYRIFRGNTRAEEDYHVYPDGVAVRHLVGRPGDQTAEGLNPTMWEVQEFILITGPGVSPHDCVEPTGFSLANLEGDQVELPWPSRFDDWTPLCALHPEVAEWREYIGIVHLRGGVSPFVAFPRNRTLFPFEDCTYCGKSHPQIMGFPRHQSYSHWPATDDTEFVGWSVAEPEDFARQATHTSFACCGYHYGGKTPPTPSSWLFLTGAVMDGVAEARKLVGSWLAPAKVETSGLFEGYAFSERAYRVRGASAVPLTVRLTPARPIINPVLRISEGPTLGRVLLDGKPLAQEEYRAQLSGEDLLLWIDKAIDREATIEIVPGERSGVEEAEWADMQSSRSR